MRLIRSQPGYRSWIAALGIMIGYWILAVTVTPRVGATFDEPGHITSGYVYWKAGDFRINAENGVLSTRAAALPLIGLAVRPPPRDSAAWRQPNTRALAGTFFFELGNDFRVLLARPRFVSALFGAALLALIWLWARHLFGNNAGWLAIGCAALSPTLLAHGGLATSDIVVSCGLLAALTAFWALWHRVTWLRLVLAGLAAGLTLLAKTSGALVVPMLVVLFAIRLLRPAPLRVQIGARPRLLRGRAPIAGTMAATSLVTATMSVLVIWCAYQFRYDAAPPGGQRELGFDPPWETVLGGKPYEPGAGSAAAGLIEAGIAQPAPGILVRGIQWSREHRVLPEAYLWSIAFTFQASRTRPSFLYGESSTTGSRWFFPAAFLLKTTPAELCLFALGLVAAFRRWPRQSIPLPSGAQSARYRISVGLYRAAPLIVLFVGYWLVALNTPLNIGHRHLLPVYPVMFVFVGAAALWWWRRGAIVAVVVLFLAVAAQGLDSVRARPFYLAYFTPAARAQPWRYLVDSSYDWGQGLPDFARWLEARKTAGDTTSVFLSYFGSDSPRARGIAVTRVADWRDDTGPRNYPAPVRGGWYAISATNFQRIYLGVSGPWSAAYEQRYQELKNSFPKDAAAANRLTPAERDTWLRNAMLFEILQFGRLCHVLGDSPPVDVVGRSILIFRVSDEEIRVVANGSLAELNAARAARQSTRR